MHPLLVAALIFTAVNIALVIRYLVNRSRSREAYQKILKSLRDRTVEVMESQSLYFDRTFPAVSDHGSGYLISIDTNRQVGAVTDPETVRLFPLSEVRECRLEEIPDHDPRRYSQVAVKILISDGDGNDAIVIRLGTLPLKRGSFVGSMVLKTAGQLQRFIQDAARGTLDDSHRQS